MGNEMEQELSESAPVNPLELIRRRRLRIQISLSFPQREALQGETAIPQREGKSGKCCVKYGGCESERRYIHLNTAAERRGTKDLIRIERVKKRDERKMMSDNRRKERQDLFIRREKNSKVIQTAEEDSNKEKQEILQCLASQTTRIKIDYQSQQLVLDHPIPNIPCFHYQSQTLTRVFQTPSDSGKRVKHQVRPQQVSTTTTLTLPLRITFQYRRIFWPSQQDRGRSCSRDVDQLTQIP